MEKEFVKFEEGHPLTGFVKLFGYVEENTNRGTSMVRIHNVFSKEYVLFPRKYLPNYIFPKKEIHWVDFSKGWKKDVGDIVELPSKELRRTTMEEYNKCKEKSDKAKQEGYAYGILSYEEIKK